MGLLSESIDDIRAAEDEYLALEPARPRAHRPGRPGRGAPFGQPPRRGGRRGRPGGGRRARPRHRHRRRRRQPPRRPLPPRRRPRRGRARRRPRVRARCSRRQQRSSLLAVAEYVAMSVPATARRRPRTWPRRSTSSPADCVTTAGGSRRPAPACWPRPSWLRAGDAPAATATLASLGPTQRLPAAERAAVSLARGMIAEASGDRRGPGARSRPGCAPSSENQSSVASFELRAFAAGHGEALRTLGARWRSPTGGPASCWCGSRRPAAG